jgi:hypothetical protein
MFLSFFFSTNFLFSRGTMNGHQCQYHINTIATINNSSHDGGGSSGSGSGTTTTTTTISRSSRSPGVLGELYCG